MARQAGPSLSTTEIAALLSGDCAVIIAGLDHVDLASHSEAITRISLSKLTLHCGLSREHAGLAQSAIDARD